MKIFLTGLPGSGKSTFGRKFAQFLGYRFVDTDDEIIRKEKMTIEEIFSTKGEQYFREKERDMLREVVANDDIVISTGGGTPCFFDNMEFINERGLSIFLNVPVKTIAKRLKKGRNKNRPMVAGKSDTELLHFLETKYTERHPFYSKAKHEIISESISHEQLMEELKGKNLF
jgi:shikimate kinase